MEAWDALREPEPPPPTSDLLAGPGLSSWTPPTVKLCTPFLACEPSLTAGSPQGPQSLAPQAAEAAGPGTPAAAAPLPRPSP